MSKKKLMSKFLCLMLLVTMLLPTAGVHESHAAGFIKCYTISSGYTRVYTSTSFRTKLGTIYPTDELQIREIQNNYVKVTYPVARGTKTGYIPTSAVLLATGGYTKESARKITTYRRNSTSKSYGYIDAGDKVIVLGTRGDFTQVCYPVSGGNKIGWIRSSDAAWKGDDDLRPIADGLYRLESTSGKRLDVNGASRTNGANIQLWEQNDSDAQIFRIEYLNNGYYKIINAGSGKVLDVDGGRAYNNANIIQYDWHGGNNQQWKITSSSSSGYYEILSRLNTDKALDIAGGVFNNGINIQLWDRNGTNAQKWRFVSYNGNPTTTTTKLSYGLYKNNKAYISCGFNGYTTTRGKHEGIDFVYYTNAPVYSLTDGEVIRVKYGKNGSSGLSTIAIYDSSANKTVIYLHSNPLSLSVGQKISRGQQIATQGWRGCSSSGGSHTHVEVRNGRQTYAAKSVNDYNLENPNPTSYWVSKGYTIQ